MPRRLEGIKVHDGLTLRDDLALVCDGQTVVSHPEEKTAELPARSLPDGVVLPGFVDLQVNGGGGVMLNDAPGVEAIRRIAQAHWRLGTTAFLPTLITDTPAQVTAAITAVQDAVRLNVPGVIGLHLEGPHLSITRKGAHDGALIRPMEDADLNTLLAAADALPNLMVTVAPESVRPDQITQLTRAGVIVSLGHSDCSYDHAMRAFDAGAQAATHLFNAMSQLNSRSPGLVGAVLARDDVHAGLIADGFHVHPGALRVALAARANGLFAVSDAMAPAGSDMQSFALGGREVHRADGRLTLEDGTLAGADLDLGRAVRVLVSQAGVPLERALRMTTGTPARLLRHAGRAGRLGSDPEGMIHLDPETGRVQRLSTLLADGRSP